LQYVASYTFSRVRCNFYAEDETVKDLKRLQE